MAKPPKDPDGVGYGRPPLASQFKPGKSGNPKGRPKGSRNFSTALVEALEERVPVTVNGKPRKLSKREVIAKQAVHKAASGDLRATSMVWKEMQAEGAQEAHATQSMRPLDANEQEVLAAVIERLRKHLSAPPPVPTASDSPTSTSERPTPRKRHVLLVRLDPLQASTGASTSRTS